MDRVSKKSIGARNIATPGRWLLANLWLWNMHDNSDVGDIAMLVI